MGQKGETRLFQRGKGPTKCGFKCGIEIEGAHRVRKLLGCPSEKIMAETPCINVICMPIIGIIGFGAKDDVRLDLVNPFEEKCEVFPIKLDESIDDVRKMNFGVGDPVNRCRFQHFLFADAC